MHPGMQRWNRNRNRNALTGELVKSGLKSIVFFDEVDAIAGDRESDTSGNMLLQMMDGIESSPDVVTLPTIHGN